MTATDADLGQLRAAHRRDYDPYAQETVAERMAELAERRAVLPMSYSMRGNGCWVATEYDTIASVLRRNNRGFVSFPIDPDGINQTGSQNGMVPLELDGPRHRAFRTMLDPMFAPKKVALLEPELTRHANDLIDAFIETGTCDFNRDFALPFPGATVMAIMGWPMRDIEMMNRWTSVIHSGDSSGDEKHRAHEQTREYMLSLIAERRAAPPRDDLTAVAMATEIEGARLGDLELVELFGLMMTAGLGTVQSVMAQSMAYFGRRQDMWAKMFASPGSVEPAIEELLRFTSPAMPTRTVTSDSVEVGGITLPRGERVHLPLSAANRDPRYYPNPEEIDFDRPHKPHLSFGLGPHRCVGVHLARLELRIGFTELHRRIPGFALKPGTEPKEFLGLAWGIEDVLLVFPPGPREQPALARTRTRSPGQARRNIEEMGTNIVRRSALAPVRNPDRLYIDGAWVAPSSDAMFDVIDSATEELFFRVAEARSADLRRAISAARLAFDEGPWPRLSHAERGGYLHAMADGLRARAEDMAQIWPRQTGLPYASAKAGLASLPGVFDFYAGLAESFRWAEPMPAAAGGFGLLVREPVGVVGAIIPWNGPASLMAYKIAPALIAGCTVIVKASPEAPGEAYVLAEVVEAAGFPAGVINIVTADRAVSEELVTDPRVDKIGFTGSTAAGRRIASLLGDRIGRFTLELGGKSAAVILDDYDIEAAAAAIGVAACRMTGQVCTLLSRVIVPAARHDAMTAALADVLARVRVGDPFDDETQMGPLSTARHRDRVEGWIATGMREGADLIVGGGRPRHLDRGYFVEPTVLGHVDNSWSVAQSEIFGPVLTVVPVADEAAAIATANDTIYGLNASVFTHDPDRFYAVARQLRSGTVGHNAWRSDFGIAFGGFKQSGVGREGGREGLLPYLETKTLIMEQPPSQY